MGLLDELARRLADELLAPRQERRRLRYEFRAALIAELRAYSQLVEQVRIAFLRIEDAMAHPPTTVRLELPAGVIEALERAYHGENVSEAPITLYAIDQQLEESDSRAIEGAQILYNRFLLDEASYVSVGAPPALAEQARERATVLDDAWARLRPQLDEALEVEAVSYLRFYRHSFRGLVHESLAVLEQRPDKPDVCIAFVRAVLRMGDAWNEKIINVSREIRER